MRAKRIGSLFVILALIQLTPPTVSPAFAKHKKARKVSDDGPQRSIRQEGALEPKKEYGFDASVQKTKDLRPTGDLRKGPGLNSAALDQTQAEELMDEKLDEEIKLAQQLLDYETGCEEVSPVRFRLADMFWEKSKRAFFRANDSSVSEAERAKQSEEMKSLQQQSLTYYQKISEDCPNYTDTPKVLFYYGRALTELERPKEGAALFKQIIKDYPGAEWVPQAWFMVGEYYFNSAGDANAALKAYTKATEFPNSPIYGFAVYKQGWCYINVAEWQQAENKFHDVVRISEDAKQPIDEKQRRQLRKEAIKDFVRTYANIGSAANALQKFRAVGNAQELPQMMENLGNWYIGQGAHGNVVTVYHDLIRTYPNSTRLAVFQGRVVDAVSRLGSPKDTVKEVKLLTDYYVGLKQRFGSAAAGAERDSMKKDLAEAQDIAENTIRRLATEYHKEAKKLRGSAQEREFAFALELYKNYLTVFPKPIENSEVNYVFFMRFYYAEVLYKLEHFLEAAQNYDAVVELNPRPSDPKEKEIVLAAAEEAVRSYDELVQDLDRKTPPDISGTAPKVIPDVKQQLISACKRYIEYVGSEGDKIVEIRYKMARIYYTYNHFDQAAPAFNDIVTNHPASTVACYSANLALDIYNGEKDYRALKAATRAYLDNQKLACGAEDRTRFAKIEEQASFHLIKTDFEEKKRYLAAGNSYMQFYKDYPTSEFADDAVYNAAVNYDLGNRLDKANEVRRFLVEKLPNSHLVPETLYNIAQSYERIVDFENASKYLDLFSKRYPKDTRSKDAVFNAALYRATLHDFAGANEGRQNYIKLYPNDQDVHTVAFSICESTEEEAQFMEEQAHAEHRMNEMDRPIARKWQDAHDCYFTYIKNNKYASADPDLVCHAQFRRGEIMRLKTKYDKGAQEQKKFLLKMWPQWKKVGVAKAPRCAAAIAELTFRDLAAPFKKYTELTIAELNPTPKGKKAFDASIKAKTTERDVLVEQYKGVAELGVAQWALAALFSIGEAYRDSIEKLLNAPIPDRIPGYKLTAEDKNLLRQQLRDMAKQIDDTAVDAYKLCVNKANELGLYNKWSVRALDQLQKLRPQEYPLVVERLVPVTFADPLTVQRNGLVIADGDELKPVRLRFKEREVAKDPAAGAASDAAKPAATAPAAAAPPPPAAAPQVPSDVPSPVEETN